MPLKGLTDEQLDVVYFNGNLLLTACPGAGKTKTLVSKTAFLLEKEIIRKTKRRIIAITYTNVAADTILERLDNYGVDSDNLWVGTIHSLCLEWILKPYRGYSDKLSKGFRIIDEYEQNKILTDLKKQFSLSYFEPIPTKLHSNYEITVPIGSKYYGVVSEYHRILRENKWIDFDLILTISLNVLADYPSISLRLSHLFVDIMVDEYQDTNQDQYEVLAAIIRYGRTVVTLIGDVDQAIYTGLGAIVKDKEQIKSVFQLTDIEERQLSGCYRSTQAVIDFYRAFQDNAIDIKSLSSADPAKTGVFYNNDISRDQLGDLISNIINEHISDGIPLDEMVILAPQWMDVINLGKRLREIMPNIEFNAPGISPIPKSRDNPWFNLIHLFFTEAKSENYSKRRRIAGRVLEDFEKMGISEVLNEDPIKKILKATNSINLKIEGSIEGFVERLILSISGYFRLDLTSYKNSVEAKEAIIEATLDRVDRYSLNNDAATLPKYFNSSNGIDVKSCHSTKGEEYDVVIATGLLKGKLPHWNDIIDQSQDHADYMARRVLYVVSSRARKYLYLISESGHTTRKGTPLIPTPQLSCVLSGR